ncbi:MAG: zinc-binding alcohol dehydrogenase [Chloroflexota bacterium]|nr:MAG: zinc-binding alcohol dehydrogenase [Chloroflexota bacterium]
MPRELIAIGPRSPGLRQYVDRAPGPGEILVRTMYGAPKHGTEMHMYRDDSPFASSRWDPLRRLFVDDRDTPKSFPRPLGNIAVGDVTKVGAGVQGVRVGDIVAGYGPLRETHLWSWAGPGAYPGVRKLPPGMTWQAAVCLDPATVALGGVRDGGVRIGDRVAVFGLGAIGLVAVQIARLAGAALVLAVDPIAARRSVALNTGADMTIDPSEDDAGMIVREATGGLGVDVAIEASGNPRALHHAIRGLAFGGTVAVIAWYGEIRGGLDLGREAHFNRPRLVFPRAESEPHDDHPRWDNRRQADAAWDLLASGRLNAEPIIHPIVHFNEVVDAYREYVDEHPEQSIKLGVVFGS